MTVEDFTALFRDLYKGRFGIKASLGPEDLECSKEIVRRLGVSWRVPPSFLIMISFQLFGPASSPCLIWREKERVFSRMAVFLELLNDQLREVKPEHINTEAIRGCEDLGDLLRNLLSDVFGNYAIIKALSMLSLRDREVRSLLPETMRDWLRDFEEPYVRIESRVFYVLKQVLRELSGRGRTSTKSPRC